MESTEPIVTRTAKSDCASLSRSHSEEDQTLIKTNATHRVHRQIPRKASSHCSRPPGTPGKMVNPSFMMRLPRRAASSRASARIPSPLGQRKKCAGCRYEISMRICIRASRPAYISPWYLVTIPLLPRTLFYLSPLSAVLAARVKDGSVLSVPFSLCSVESRRNTSDIARTSAPG